MSSITKVALAGASGNLGPAILEQLLQAGFEVTVLTRQGSTHTFPAGATVTPVDYDSLASLTEALRGQDAVVSTLASLALAKQLLLVQAAAAAGVRRFLPSEFGSDTVHPRTAKLPCFGDKVAVQEALAKEAAKPAGMTYTLVIGGPFLDWGMQVGFVMSPKGKHIALYDGGHRRFSATSLPTLGKAVVGVLRQPDATRNRPVYVQDTAKTLQELLAMGKTAAGPDGWTEEEVAIDDVLAGAWAELQKERPDPNNFVLQFIKASIWGEGYGSLFTEHLDNELLGIPQLSDAELQEMINGLAK